MLVCIRVCKALEDAQSSLRHSSCLSRGCSLLCLVAPFPQVRTDLGWKLLGQKGPRLSSQKGLALAPAPPDRSAMGKSAGNLIRAELLSPRIGLSKRPHPVVLGP